VLTVDVAEATLALLLSSTRLIAQADAFVRAEKWEAGQNFQLDIRLAGKQVGIIGVGKIVSEIARLLGGFNVQISYVSRFTQLAGAQLFVHLAELAEWSDILICAIAATAETRNMIDASILEKLGPEGIFVNVSLGGVVSGAGMIEGLADKRLGGATLDVFSDEPHVPQALKNMPNVVLTPHMASASLPARQTISDIVVQIVLNNRGHPTLLVGLVK